MLLANLRGSNNQRAKCVFQANSRHKLACRHASAVMLANSSASSHRARVQIVSLGRFPSGREGDSNILVVLSLYDEVDEFVDNVVTNFCGSAPTGLELLWAARTAQQANTPQC